MCPWCNKEFESIVGAPSGGIPNGAATVCTACGNFAIIRMPEKLVEKMLIAEFEQLDIQVQAMLTLMQREVRGRKDLDIFQLMMRHRNN